MHLQQFSSIVANVSELFCVSLYTNYECYSYRSQSATHVFKHVKHIHSFYYISGSLSILKFNNKKFCSLIRMYLNSFICTFIQTICQIAIKKFQIAFNYDTYNEYQKWSFTVIYFSYADDKQTGTQTQTSC